MTSKRSKARHSRAGGSGASGSGGARERTARPRVRVAAAARAAAANSARAALPARAAAAPSADTRAVLLADAMDLIETQGFCAFSYADLAARVGIRKPSVHHHFPTKSDLAVAAVQRALAHSREMWDVLTREHPRARDRLLALFACVREKAASGSHICPVGALQAEFNALPAPVQQALRELADAYLETLSDWLAQGRRAGELEFPGSPRAMAQVVVCVMQAGLQRQRSNPAELVDDALAQLRRLLGI